MHTEELLLKLLQIVKQNKHKDSNLDLELELELKLEKYEPILIENKNRYVMFPIQYHDAWNMYKKHHSSMWVCEEVDLSNDISQFEKLLTDNEKYYITYVLAFFSCFDGIVNENLTERFMSEIQVPEIRAFYGFQIMIENVHNEMYSLLIDTFISNDKKDFVFNAIENFPAIKKMANWAIKWIHSKLPFNRRILAYTCIEGIMFSAQFASINWFKKRGILNGLTFSNELISKDEGLHMEFGVLMHNTLKYPASIEIIHEIVSETVSLCKEFVTESLPCALIGMNSNDMIQYIEYISDRLLIQLNAPVLFNSKNPFTGWLDMISLDHKTNFFERKVAEYSKANSNLEIINNMTIDKNEILDEF